MDITEELHDGVLVLRIRGARLDAVASPLLERELLRRIEEGRSRIVVDLSAVVFMASGRLRALVAGIKRLGSREGLIVVGARGAVQRLFELTRMDQVFDLEPTLEEALKRTSR